MRRVTRATAAGRAYLDLQNKARRQGRPTQEQDQYRLYRDNLGSQGEHLPHRLSELTRIVTAFAAPLTSSLESRPTHWVPATSHWDEPSES